MTEGNTARWLWTTMHSTVAPEQASFSKLAPQLLHPMRLSLPPPLRRRRWTIGRHRRMLGCPEGHGHNGNWPGAGCQFGAAAAAAPPRQLPALLATKPKGCLLLGTSPGPGAPQMQRG